MENVAETLPFPLQYAGTSTNAKAKLPLLIELSKLGIKPLRSWSIVFYKCKQSFLLYSKGLWKELHNLGKRRGVHPAFTTFVYIATYIPSLFNRFEDLQWVRNEYSEYLYLSGPEAFTAMPAPPPAIRDMADNLAEKFPDAEVSVESFDIDPLLIVSYKDEEYVIGAW